MCLAVTELGRNTLNAISGRRYKRAESTSCSSGKTSAVRGVYEAMDRYHRSALARSAVKVELSRTATTLLHSEAALTPGDLTRAGTARAAADCKAGHIKGFRDTVG